MAGAPPRGGRRQSRPLPAPCTLHGCGSRGLGPSPYDVTAHNTKPGSTGLPHPPPGAPLLRAGRNLSHGHPQFGLCPHHHPASASNPIGHCGAAGVPDTVTSGDREKANSLPGTQGTCGDSGHFSGIRGTCPGLGTPAREGAGGHCPQPERTCRAGRAFPKAPTP